MNRYMFLLGIILLFTGFGDGDAIYNNRGNGYFNKKEYKKALKFYNKIKNKDNRYVAEYNSGNALIKSGNLQKGLKYLSDVAENAGRDMASKSYYNMGNALFNAKKYQKAADMYVNALKLKPDYENAKYNLEKTLRMIKKNKQNNKNKNNNNKKKNKNRDKSKKNKNNKQNNRKNENRNKNQNQSKKQNENNRKSLSKKEAERILNALMRNRKPVKKDSTAMRKLLSPRFLW